MVPIEETLEALNDVVSAGKALLHRRVVDVRVAVREGAARLRAHGWARFQTMQNYLNLLYREEEREMLPLCGPRASASSRGARSPAAA